MIRLNFHDPIPERLKGAIVALGNFDGFHAGHQAVVGEAVRWARAEGRPAAVATFDPHPVRYFVPDAPPFRLTSLDQRQDLFAEAGAEAMLIIRFNARTAGSLAEEWVRDGLVGHLGAAGVVTGEDFTFGKGRQGNIAALRDLGARYGLRARAVGAVTEGGEIISSTRIRDALRAGDCETASRLLTRPFTIRGTVQHGDKLGRTINFPTANLSLENYLRPRFGIYAVTGRVLTGEHAGPRLLAGAANLGIRPTFDPPKELLEPHFFDFSGDLYGATIEVALRHYLRPEAKFASVDELVVQMRRDCEEARKLLSAPPA